MQIALAALDKPNEAITSQWNRLLAIEKSLAAADDAWMALVEILTLGKTRLTQREVYPVFSSLLFFSILFFSLLFSSFFSLLFSSLLGKTRLTQREVMIELLCSWMHY